MREHFRDGQECIFYRGDNLEPLLLHYLTHEDERRALAEAARGRAQEWTFARQLDKVLEEFPSPLAVSGAAVEKGAGTPAVGAERSALLRRCWQAQGSSRFDDTKLIGDLEKALETEPQSAELCNALGVAVGRQSQGRGAYPFAAETASEYFRRAVESEPGHIPAGLNLVEALFAAGQKLRAIDAARRTVEQLQKEAADTASWIDAPIFSKGFDVFGMEWERAAWSHAGSPAEEAQAKRVLALWRLHLTLGRLAGDMSSYYEARLLQPELAQSHAAVGAALLHGGRPADAVGHLKKTWAANPFDREIAYLYYQALGGINNTKEQRRVVEDRRLLAMAAPQPVPPDAWFAQPCPKPDALASIIILCCNQVDYTRLCIESVLRHSRRPYELVLVDNGSSDGTAGYLQEIARREGPQRVEIIRNESNVGFPAGCNQALGRSRGEYVVLLNNDTVVTAGWLEGLVGWVRHEWPMVGLVGAVSNYAPDAQGVRPGYSKLEDLDTFASKRRQGFAGKPLLVGRLTGFCLLARRDVLERLGGFDERFESGFFDDDDLCVRAREAGYRLVVAQEVYIHHFGSRTFEALGINVRDQLTQNFERFQTKWGTQYTAGYRLPGTTADKAGGSQGDDRPKPTEVEIAQAAASLETAAEAAEIKPATVLERRGGQRGRKSLCMIVRNEEKNLPDCLRSVEGLFDEMIVVDTGSTDRTIEVAQGFGAKVFEFPWPDSFARARNESVRHATGDWIMWLDADDRLDAENRRELEKLLATLGDELDAYAMKVRSVLDANRTAFRLLDQVRLFRNLPEILWDYRVHEQILPAVNRAGGMVRWANVVVDHVGYQDPRFRRGKLERNLRLLELDFADRPNDAFTLFNLGWTLLDLGRKDEALTHLEHALKETKPTSSTLRKLYHLLALTQKSVGRADEAMMTCRDGLEKFADDGELLSEEGFLLRDKGDLEGAEQSWLRLLDARRGQYFASEEQGLRGYKTRQLLAEIYRAQQRSVEAEVQWRAALAEQPDFELAWQGLSELYLKSGRWTELEYLLEGLETKDGIAPKLGWLRARGQFQRKEFPAARRTLHSVIVQDPQAIGPRVLLSHVLLQEGRDWPATEQALRDVLAIDPNHAESKHNLKVLLRRLGREVAGV